MNNFIKNLSKITKDDLPEVGGKGANLGELLINGFPIPGGFVVTTTGYKEFFSQTDLKEQIDKLSQLDSEELEKSCVSIQDKIKQKRGSNLWDSGGDFYPSAFSLNTAYSSREVRCLYLAFYQSSAFSFSYFSGP